MEREKITITKRKAKGVLADMIANMDLDSLAKTREKMERITEDYCSYELAKLLNEKGFYGHTHGNLSEIPCVPQITYQIACKWLREVHNICIEPYAAAYRFGFTISKLPTGSNICNDDVIERELVTYPEAIEAALNYAIENLI